MKKTKNSRQKLRSLFTTAAGLIILIATGCQSNGTNKQITIKSEPAGAMVFDGDEQLGVTPLKLKLSPDSSHSFTFRKLYFNEAQGIVSPQPNEKAEKLVKFGPLEDAGYYVDLLPNPLVVELVPEIVPTGIGSNPLGDMAASVYKLDTMLAERKITRKEHTYIVEKLTEFYEAQTTF